MVREHNGRTPGQRYSEEEIERGLNEVALCAGNTHRAHRQLEDRGLQIPRPTLEKWTSRQHVERYERIREQVLPRIHAKLAAESEDLARAYAEAEHATLERFREELPNLRAHEAAGAVRNLATSRGISTDKANLLRNRPTAVVEHRQAEDIIRRLQAVGVLEEDELIEGTVEEEPAELPPAT